MKRVISIKRLRAFWEQHADAEIQLRDWYRIASKASWRHIQDVRVDFPHADSVVVRSGRPITVFNICGNKYRLVADVLYKVQIIYVCTVLTHAEYSKEQKTNYEHNASTVRFGSEHAWPVHRPGGAVTSARNP
jgi:mRNA interferase HigB